jgi:hypothetical protein
MDILFEIALAFSPQNVVLRFLLIFVCVLHAVLCHVPRNSSNNRTAAAVMLAG